jgi:hypothetical protein
LQKIHLPAMAGNVSVADALAAVETERLGSMVVSMQSGPRLVFLSDLDAAHRTGTAHLKDIGSFEDLAPGGEREMLSEIASSGIAAEATDIDYVGSVEGSRAVVFTRHEFIAERLLKRLLCEAQPPHKFPRPSLKAGVQCPLCPQRSIVSYR